MLYDILRKFLFALPPERAHTLTLGGLQFAEQCGLLSLYQATLPDTKPITLLGQTFPCRVGLSAGLDRNGACAAAWFALGFGFIELGTVTPRPQSGNPQPRLFRLPQANALINRMGFHNDGCQDLVQRLSRVRAPQQGVIGISIGKNKETSLDRAYQDYEEAFRAVAPHADYVALNISSPNTVGLRKLQDRDHLVQLLGHIKMVQQSFAQESGHTVPLLVKLSPDMSATALHETVDIIVQAGMDGIIVTNTTLSREGVSGLPHAQEVGGLSGQPLFAQSSVVVASVRHQVGSGFPIIAVGGIFSAEDARTMVGLGADLVQIYTGLIYRGPALVREIRREFG